MSKLLGHTTHDHSAEFVIARAVHVAPAGACMGCHKVIQTAVQPELPIVNCLCRRY